MTRRIAVKLARTGVGIAVLLGIVLSVVQIVLDYQDELERNDTLVQNILHVASAGATQAAFELSTTQAEAALQPLTIYAFLNNLEIVSDSGERLHSIAREVPPNSTDWIARWLNITDKMYSADLFHTQSNLTVGQLKVIVHRATALEDFFVRSIRLLIAGVLRSLILAAVLVLVFNFFLSRPLLDLLASLRRIDPRHPEPIAVPDKIKRANNELTELASSINSTLSANRDYLAELRTSRRVADDAMDKLRQSERLSIIGKLVGGVAHDFNNILAIILGAFEFLRDQNALNRDGRNLVTTGITATQRGASLTSQLLAYSRRQPLDPKPIAVKDFFVDLEDMLIRSLGERYTTEFTIGGSIWSCFADVRQLETVILNLAVNARDAMPNGGNLTIEALNTRLDLAYCQQQEDEVEPGQYVCFAVTDNGTGMSQEVMENAFEPYFTTKEVGQGSGLGLSMAYGFIKQSGGHIKIYSEPGDGTTIKLYLPRIRTNGHEPPSEADEDQAGAPRLAGLTFLVVEDDQTLSQVLVSNLKKLNINAIVAHDGNSAIEKANQAEHLDGALIDVVLPGKLNGRDLSEALLAQRPDLPIAFMSGYTENAIIHNARLDKGTVFLQKPFPVKELELVLDRIVPRSEDR